jgi:hypothetical protein
VGRGSKRQ